MYLEDYPNNDVKAFILFSSEYPFVMLCDPYLIEDAFVKNNKYLSKAEYSKNVMYPLMGESILMAESSPLWNRKRKVLSASFYKDKLVKMIKLV